MLMELIRQVNSIILLAQSRILKILHKVQVLLRLRGQRALLNWEILLDKVVLISSCPVTWEPQLAAQWLDLGRVLQEKMHLSKQLMEALIDKTATVHLAHQILLIVIWNKILVIFKYQIKIKMTTQNSHQTSDQSEVATAQWTTKPRHPKPLLDWIKAALLIWSIIATLEVIVEQVVTQPQTCRTEAAWEAWALATSTRSAQRFQNNKMSSVSTLKRKRDALRRSNS